MNNALSGIAKVFQTEPETIKPAELRGAAIVSIGAGIVIGSMVTRKRVDEGKEPILGFLF